MNDSNGPLPPGPIGYELATGEDAARRRQPKASFRRGEAAVIAAVAFSAVALVGGGAIWRALT
jgi:hypothetical protein